ncbi:MAG TPA: VCBS repeat-containing protein, partial [Polyangia bacterium]
MATASQEGIAMQRFQTRRIARGWLVGGAGAAFVALLVGTAPPAAAGETGAQTTVNAFSGALTSSIPIGVPGFRGLEPKLELAYSSSGGNGVVGVGWGLSGLSVIERASPGGGAPRFDGSDIYRLDGNVLIPCAQAAGSPSCTSGGTHATRVESFGKIAFDGVTWTVWQRTGVKATYAARGIAGRSDFRWTLASVTDTKGNTVAYNWWCDGSNECYLDTVTYNGTTVKVYYETRGDTITYAVGGAATCYDTCYSTCYGTCYQYCDTYGCSACSGPTRVLGTDKYGNPVTQACSGYQCNPYQCNPTSCNPHACPGQGLATISYRVKTIDVLMSGSRARAYKLTYATSGTTSRSLLSGVQQFGQDATLDGTGTVTGGTALPAMTATPAAASNGVGLQGWWGPTGNGSFAYAACSTRVVPGDFNGDGKMDYACGYDYGSSNAALFVWLSTETGFSLQQWWLSGAGNFSWSACGGRFTAGDFNGDGKTDLACGYDYGSSNAALFTFVSTGSSFSTQQWWLSGAGNFSWSACGGRFTAGDFNGDGKTD